MSGRPRVWGRWGEDDERGALNLVDAEAVRRALAAVERGEVIPLGLPVQSRRVPVMPHRPPVLHTMLVDGADFAAGARRGANGFQFADDHLSMAVHSGTHIDALSHVARDGLMYNGVPATEVRSAGGARRLGIDGVGGVVCRGVLLDVAGEHGGRLDPRHAIGVRDLEGALERAGTHLEPGDAALIRTGWLVEFDDRDVHWHESEPGLGLEGARWLAEHDVALVGADNFAVEVVPSESGEVLPVHLALLQEHGVYLMELVDLEPLVRAGAATFALVVAPLRITGGVGSPVNPIAII